MLPIWMDVPVERKPRLSFSWSLDERRIGPSLALTRADAPLRFDDGVPEQDGARSGTSYV